MSKTNGINIPVSKEAAAGAAAYSKFVLSIYDIEVLMFEMRFIFKCPSHNAGMHPAPHELRR